MVDNQEKLPIHAARSRRQTATCSFARASRNSIRREGDSGGPVVRQTSSTTVTALGIVYYHYSYYCNWPVLCHRGVFSTTSAIVQEMYFASNGAYYFDPTNSSTMPTAPSPPTPPSWYAVI